MYNKIIKSLLITIISGSSLIIGALNASADIEIINRKKDSTSIDVSINTYGDGQSKYYNIEPFYLSPPYYQSGTETWSRSDNKGFLVAVSENYEFFSPAVYYSHKNEKLTCLESNKLYGKNVINTDEARYVKDNQGNYIYSTEQYSGVTNKVIVRNNSTHSKNSVALSTWSGGDSSYYKVGVGEVESWGRQYDNRGYLLNIDGQKYYVMSGEYVYITNSYVFINNKATKPCG